MNTFGVAAVIASGLGAAAEAVNLNEAPSSGIY